MSVATRAPARHRLTDPEVGLGKRIRSLVPLVRLNHNVLVGRRGYTDRELVAAIRAEQKNLELQWSRLEAKAVELESRGCA